jgi:gamma-glutamyltranspeptidase
MRRWDRARGQGVAALMALNSLEQDAAVPAAAWGGPEHVHALVESMRLGFVDALAYNADPEATGVPTADLLSKEYAKRRRAELYRPDQARAACCRCECPRGSDSDRVCQVQSRQVRCMSARGGLWRAVSG